MFFKNPKILSVLSGSNAANLTEKEKMKKKRCSNGDIVIHASVSSLVS